MAIPLKSRLRSVGTLEAVVSHPSAMPAWSPGGLFWTNHEVLPGGNLSPNHLGEKDKANKGVVQFPKTHYKAHMNFDEASHVAPSYLL